MIYNGMRFFSCIPRRGFYRHLFRRRYSDGVASELSVPPLNRGSDFVPVSFGSLRAPLITPSAKGLMKILS